MVIHYKQNMEILKPKKKKKEICIINTILLKMFYLEVEESLNIKEYRNDTITVVFQDQFSGAVCYNSKDREVQTKHSGA